MVHLIPLPPPSSLTSLKSRMIESFWYLLTQVVLEKRPLNTSDCRSVPSGHNPGRAAGRAFRRGGSRDLFLGRYGPKWDDSGKDGRVRVPCFDNVKSSRYS